MLSPKAVSHVKACRFCWMCRHLCPVQLQTGKEVNTPRAKAVLLDMIENGQEFDKDIAEAMFECLLCDACTNDCATGYEPPMFIKEARTEAWIKDLLPAGVKAVKENLEKTGNIYGEELVNYEGSDENASVLVYLGATARNRAAEMTDAFLALLKQAGVAYKLLDNEPASGAMYTDLLGNVEEASDYIEPCAEAINNAGVDTVVVLDSYDLAAFRQLYPEFGQDIVPETVSGVSYILRLVKEGKLSVKTGEERIAAYHDDSRSARVLGELEEPRELLATAGVNLVEMFNTGKLSKCGGTSLTLAYMPEITVRTAAGRWDDILRNGKAEIMVVSNPQAYEVLKNSIPEGKELKDIYSILA